MVGNKIMAIDHEELLFLIEIISKVVVPRYGDYSDIQNTGLRKIYKIDGQVSICNLKHFQKSMVPPVLYFYPIDFRIIRITYF